MKIDKDVPFPPLMKRGRPGRFEWGKFEVGDSAYFDIQTYYSARSSAYSFGDRHKMKFIARREGDGGRVWRVK